MKFLRESLECMVSNIVLFPLNIKKNTGLTPELFQILSYLLGVCSKVDIIHNFSKKYKSKFVI